MESCVIWHQSTQNLLLVSKHIQKKKLNFVLWPDRPCIFWLLLLLVHLLLFSPLVCSSQAFTSLLFLEPVSHTHTAFLQTFLQAEILFPQSALQLSHFVQYFTQKPPSSSLIPPPLSNLAHDLFYLFTSKGVISWGIFSFSLLPHSKFWPNSTNLSWLEN